MPPTVDRLGRSTPVPVLRSSVDTTSEEYQRNRATQLAAVTVLDEQLELARAGGGERYIDRHRDRGRLLARERIELLVNRDSPLLELSPSAPASLPASAWSPAWNA